MTPIEKAKWLAEFYGAVAAGKTVQEAFSGKWKDISTDDFRGPDMGSNTGFWRIKPEPRRMWTWDKASTDKKHIADEWKAQCFTVTEWLEVV